MKRFEVWGGKYLDENYQPYSKTIHIPGERTVFIELDLPSQMSTVDATVEAVDEGVPAGSATATLNRIGGTGTIGRYFGQITLSNQAEPGELPIPEFSILTTSYLGMPLVGNPAVDLRITVEEIAFNHDPTSFENDALNIRWDYDTPIELPEYEKGKLNDPAAYVRNKDVTLKVKLAANTHDRLDLRVQGFSTDSDGVMGNTEPVDLVFHGFQASQDDFPMADTLPNYLAQGLESWDCAASVPGQAIPTILQ